MQQQSSLLACRAVPCRAVFGSASGRGQKNTADPRTSTRSKHTDAHIPIKL